MARSNKDHGEPLTVAAVLTYALSLLLNLYSLSPYSILVSPFAVWSIRAQDVAFLGDPKLTAIQTDDERFSSCWLLGAAAAVAVESSWLGCW